MKMATVLITGASAGIGRELALAFARHGFDVAACARSAEALERLSRAAEPGRIAPFACDVTDAESVERIVSRVIAERCRIDLLINNVGTLGPIGPVHEIEPARWQACVDANLLSTFLVTRFVVPHMLHAGSGKILNLSGGSVGAGPLPFYSAYASSKSAVVSFTETIAAELADRNLQVNAIAPGFVPTRIHEATLRAGARAGEVFDATKAALASEDSGRAAGRVCELALFLASPEAGAVTGRLFSAKWDNWREMVAELNATSASARGTLRRIDGGRFVEERWKLVE